MSTTKARPGTAAIGRTKARAQKRQQQQQCQVSHRTSPRTPIPTKKNIASSWPTLKHQHQHQLAAQRTPTLKAAISTSTRKPVSNDSNIIKISTPSPVREGISYLDASKVFMPVPPPPLTWENDDNDNHKTRLLSALPLPSSSSAAPPPPPLERSLSGDSTDSELQASDFDDEVPAFDTDTSRVALAAMRLARKYSFTDTGSIILDLAIVTFFYFCRMTRAITTLLPSVSMCLIVFFTLILKTDAPLLSSNDVDTPMMLSYTSFLKTILLTTMLYIDWKVREERQKQELRRKLLSEQKRKEEEMQRMRVEEERRRKKELGQIWEMSLQLRKLQQQQQQHRNQSKSSNENENENENTNGPIKFRRLGSGNNHNNFNHTNNNNNNNHNHNTNYNNHDDKKMQWHTRDDAEWVIAQMRKKGMDRHGKLNSYYNPEFDRWFVGRRW